MPNVPGWTLVTCMNKGARTIVYSARPAGSSEALRDDYAIKLVRPSRANDALATRLLRREALVGRKASHPHLVPILACGLDEPPYYLVMPRLRGVTLARLIRDAGALPISRALWIVRQIAEGLEALHEFGWLHGDVKPANILVGIDGHTTLLDFGFARRIEQTFKRGTAPVLTTLDYASPENFVTSRGCDQRSDIFSLGVTLFETITGLLPVDGTRARSREAGSRCAPGPTLHPRNIVPAISRELSHYLMRMLAKEPLRRPASCREVARDLIRFEIDALASET